MHTSQLPQSHERSSHSNSDSFAANSGFNLTTSDYYSVAQAYERYTVGVMAGQGTDGTPSMRFARHQPNVLDGPNRPLARLYTSRSQASRPQVSWILDSGMPPLEAITSASPPGLFPQTAEAMRSLDQFPHRPVYEDPTTATDMDTSVFEPRPSQQLPAQAQVPHVQPSLSRSLHRVQIIRCGHCDTFLTDRGMRAVLLLKPSFTLYSTDAQPLNAGPLFYSDEEYARISTSERTCECLTQAIGCYGCGWSIGYHIVSPCKKCTRSVSKHEGTANGHRFVFHYGEVIASDRRYVEGEVGVKPHHELPQIKVVMPFNQRSQQVSNIETDVGNTSTTEPSFSASQTHPRRQSIKEPQPPQIKPIHYEARFFPPLKQGDALYWHHLKSAGERARPIDPSSMRPRRPSCER